MAPRNTSAISDGSQKENSGLGERDKTRSSKQSDVQRTRRQPADARAKGRALPEDEDAEMDAQEDGAHTNGAEDANDDDEANEDESPKGRKRARVNANGDARIADTSAPVPTQIKSKKRADTFARDRDK